MASKVTKGSITSAESEAKAILEAALDKLRTAVKPETPGAATEPRVFFPNGIELISITVSIGAVKVELKVAGEKGIKGLLESRPNTDEVGKTAIVEQIRA